METEEAWVEAEIAKQLEALSLEDLLLHQEGLGTAQGGEAVRTQVGLSFIDNSKKQNKTTTKTACNN